MKGSPASSALRTSSGKTSGTDRLIERIALQSQLQMSALQGGAPSALPSWAAFFFWIGWWLRVNAKQDRRLLAIVVAPTRLTAALFAAFGAQIAGAQHFNKELDWLSLTELSPGTDVFVQFRKDSNKSGGKQVRGKVLGLRELYGQDFVHIHQIGVKDAADIYLNVALLSKYTITLAPLSNTAKTAIHKHGALFKKLLRGFDPSWFLSPSLECALVGDAAPLLRESESIWLGTRGQQALRLDKLLGFETAITNGHSKVSFLKLRSLPEETTPAPLCICDGIAAMRSLTQCVVATRATSVLVVLDRGDFDEQAHDLALQWIAASDASLVPPIESRPVELPPGIECAVSGIKLQPIA